MPRNSGCQWPFVVAFPHEIVSVYSEKTSMVRHVYSEKTVSSRKDIFLRENPLERCVLLYTVFLGEVCTFVHSIFFLIEVGTCARRSGGQTSGGTGGRTRFSVPGAAPGTYAVKRPGASAHRPDGRAVVPRAP